MDDIVTRVLLWDAAANRLRKVAGLLNCVWDASDVVVRTCGDVKLERNPDRADQYAHLNLFVRLTCDNPQQPFRNVCIARTALDRPSSAGSAAEHDRTLCGLSMAPQHVPHPPHLLRVVSFFHVLPFAMILHSCLDALQIAK